MSELKLCPFCGGQAAVKDCSVGMTDAKTVSCERCHIRTAPVLVDHPSLTVNGLDETTRYTPEQAAQKVIERWNRRESDGNA